MEAVFDHIKIGKELKSFVFPPFKTPDILGFEGNLREIVPQKLGELLQRTKFLKDKKEFELRLIKATTKADSIEEYFWVTLTFHDFSEYYVIQKWLNYWLSLWYKITLDDLPQSEITRQLGRVSPDDIQRAKQTPIQDYYDGQLRKSANRLVGLCPFHSEKTPSFNIFPDNNTFKCFGCQEFGDSISFIQETKNLSFPEAVRLLI